MKRNIRTTIIFLFLQLSLISCTKTTINQKDSGIRYMVAAEHARSKYSEVLDIRYFQFLDDNKISYETHWDSDTGFNSFSQVKEECSNSFGTTQHGNPWIIPSEIDTSSYLVNIHKPLISCILSKGYRLTSSAAFFPRSYTISISRSHTDTGQKLGVGFTMRAVKPKSNYSDLMNVVKYCHLKAYRDYGVEEKHLSYMVSVSVEKYSEEIKRCLQEKEYTLIL